MKDIAAVRSAGHRQFQARLDGGAKIRDEGAGGQAAISSLEQTNPPGLAVAALFAAKQKAVGGFDVGGHEHRLAVLIDFIETGVGNVGEIRHSVVRASLVDGGMDDVVHRANGQERIEKIAAKLEDAPIGTMATESQTQSDLPEPVLGDR